MMNDLTFRRDDPTVICSHLIGSAVALIFMVFLFGAVFKTNFPYDMTLEPSERKAILLCLAAIVFGVLTAIFAPQLVHGYDTICINRDGITIKKYYFFKEEKTEDVLTWNDVKRVIIYGGTSGAHFMVSTYDNRNESFFYSRRISAFLKSVYPGIIENHYFKKLD